MASIKPNEFPIIPTLDGTEELYTQTGGTNGKFTTAQVAALSIINYSITPIETGRKWIDGQPELEVVLNISGHVTGNNYKHDLGVATYISVEGYTWQSASPSTIYALNRNDSAGTLSKFQYLNLDANNINTIKTDTGYDRLLFIVKFTKVK
jgi:hypothetical protein